MPSTGNEIATLRVRLAETADLFETVSTESERHQVAARQAEATRVNADPARVELGVLIDRLSFTASNQPYKGQNLSNHPLLADPTSRR
ncbi:hypothetical protein [Micromonospora sp. NBC_01412]|uniref:hypothetical protein n=1 Tax=Micromonospora sp. NBC_01412 TaxID=2903590 RepID=UPI003247D59F